MPARREPVCPTEVRIAEDCKPECSVLEIRIAKIRGLKVRAHQICTAQIGTIKIYTGRAVTRQIGLVSLGFKEIGNRVGVGTSPRISIGHTTFQEYPYVRLICHCVLAYRLGLASANLPNPSALLIRKPGKMLIGCGLWLARFQFGDTSPSGIVASGRSRDTAFWELGPIKSASQRRYATWPQNARR
jgi:hypothetical protein